MTEVRGRRVTLRPFRADELDVAMLRLTRFDGGAMTGARERLERSGTRTRWEVLFAIEAGGRMVGAIQARTSDEVLPPGVWELGVELFDPADRGRGLGREAVKLATSHVFEEEDAIRVQASTDVENGAMRRVFDRLGFGFEGVLRGFMPSAKGPRDYALYGMTRNDWDGMKDSWTRTS